MNKIVLNAQNMQKTNRLKVLNFIRENGMVRRPEIAAHTGLSLSSVTNIVVHLMKNGLVADNGVEDVTRVGRKADLLSFNYSAYRFIYVNIGRDKITVSLTDMGLSVLSVDERRPAGCDIETVISAISEMVSPKMRKEYDKVLAVGVSVSALIKKDKVFSSTHKWEAADIRGCLEQELQKPVYVFNKTMLKAVGCVSSGKNDKNVLFVDLEEGIGSVVIEAGKPNHEIIGEIGHTTVNPLGEKCFCGNCGCLEAMCSPERIVKIAAKSMGECTYSDVCCAADDGNELARAAMDECLEYLGIGLANLVNILNPEEIIINASELLTADYAFFKTVEVFKDRLLPQLRDDIAITKLANFNDDYIKKGMSTCLCDEVFSLEYTGYSEIV